MSGQARLIPLDLEFKERVLLALPSFLGGLVASKDKDLLGHWVFKDHGVGEVEVTTVALQVEYLELLRVVQVHILNFGKEELILLAKDHKEKVVDNSDHMVVSLLQQTRELILLNPQLVPLLIVVEGQLLSSLTDHAALPTNDVNVVIP